MTHGDGLLPLGSVHRPGLTRADFMVSSANAAAVQAIDNWTGWRDRRLALIGPAGSGKSHLARIWCDQTAGHLVEACDLTDIDLTALMDAGAVAIEDADRLAQVHGRREAEEILFHLANHAAGGGGALLMTGRMAPARWDIATPDLASRLAATQIAQLASPDDDLLMAVLVKLFTDRQLQVNPDVIDYMARRIDRDISAAVDIVARLDRQAMINHRKISRSFVAEVMGTHTGRKED